MQDYLKEMKFEKQLKTLKKKLKNKKIVIYGTGLLFKEIMKTYDLSDLNIIGVSDRKYSSDDEGNQEFGFPIIPLDRIAEYKPDFVLVATLKFLSIIDTFRNVDFVDTNIKILPLVDKPFFTLLKEIFE